jgi:hypothetical protein
MYAFTALFGLFRVQKPQSASPLCGFVHPHCQPQQTYGLLYKVAVNVAYNGTLDEIAQIDSKLILTFKKNKLKILLGNK